jgi:hypothetical protein
MADFYKDAYLQIVKSLDNNYEYLKRIHVDNPFSVSIPVEVLDAIKAMVQAYEDAEDND